MAAPSRQTLTFLFTDIEGSTPLWEQHHQAMTLALTRHDALLRQVLEERGGHVFKHVGDALYAAFGNAADAVAAATAAQEALAREPWPLPEGLRVRMAVHTGSAELRGGDYAGRPLNLAARLVAAGHGGQVVLSDATRALVAGDLPPGVELRDLGLHRLAGLAHPERIWQLLVPGLPADFPPLRTLDTLPNNLPRPLTTFVGRERELGEIAALLQRTRLVTLTGPGGGGKTRLALQVASDLLRRFPDGVWWVELAALRDESLIPQRIAAAVGVHEEVHRPLALTLADALAARRLLLVVDNCEHLLAGCAEAARHLLERCPELRVLATSQEPLGVPGEVVYRVRPLALPDPQATPTLTAAEQSEAVRLFLDRAALSQPRFRLTEATAPVVLQICRRLDGIPLAIELAAARLGALSLEQVASRLDDRFRLLTRGDRGAPTRHQMLRAALDWSYDLLAEAERTLLRRLAVFAGGFDVEAAEAVTADDPAGVASGTGDGTPAAGDGPGGRLAAADVLDVLSRLVEKSFVLFDEERGRYTLLETVRLYAQEHLVAAGEEQHLRDRHRDHYLGLARLADPALGRPGQEGWLDRLAADHDNLRTALAWSLESGAVDAGLRLAGQLWRYWEIRGHWREGRAWLDVLLDCAGEASAEVRVPVLNGAAFFAFFQGDFARGVQLAQESLELARQLGDTRSAVHCLNILGFEACRIERYDAAAQLGEESLALSRQVGDALPRASALSVLGLVARGRRRYQEARGLLEEAVRLARVNGDRALTALVLTNLGLVITELGDYAEARRVQEETLALTRAIGDTYGMAFALSNLAIIAWHEDERGRAAALFAESLRLRHQLGERRGMATALTGLGVVAAREGQAERAAVLLGAGEALRERLGIPPPPFIRDTYPEHVATVRDALGEHRFQETWEHGRTLPLDNVVAYAVGGRQAGQPPGVSSPDPSGATT
ncbi:MAG: tetratricopeptide repeat protein [Armatimonadota bacterium]|nr:tetratricopeptide repeat protein [Armatimonadota bacterium]MDR7480742.1 tetratricopeptide repeat protein [Armatimonadota bacterium]MDR7488912.1 tetratricopeptide repeat protein [Armatimonadota bacterium]MDR7492345.1 tetratricopeptide repeat protein [Armatimonadota bacterium]MDR7503077.1 tetratricopeptide repeat protein [Armatimonadota bacterium]